MTTTMNPVLACVCAAAWLLASQGEARAADVLFKNAPGTTSLTNNTNWDGGALPGGSETATWGAAVGGNSLGGSLSWASNTTPSYQGIKVVDASANIAITSAGGATTLTLGSGGIDMSAAAKDLSIHDSSAASTTLGIIIGANQAWNVGTSRTLAVGNSDTTITLSNNLTKTGAGAFTLGGTGITTLTGSGVLEINGGTFTNNMQTGSSSAGRSGATTLTSGSLIINTTISLFGTGTINLNGGTIGSGNANGRDLGSNAVNIGGNVQIGSGTGYVQFNGATDLGGAVRQVTSTATGVSSGFGAGAVFTGIVANGGITKAGAGIMTLSNNGNTFAGATTVTAGNLAVSTGALANSSSVTIGAAGVLSLGLNGNTAVKDLTGASGAQIRTDFTITGGNGSRVLAVNQTVDGTYAGSFTEGGSRPISILKSGAATLTLSGATPITGTVSISAGTLKMGGSGTLGASGTYSGAITNDGTLHIDSTADQILSGAIGGAGQLIKSNSGTLSLSTGNSYGGGTLIRGGTINWNNNSALSAGTVTLNDAATGASNTGLNRNAAGTLANNIVVASQGSGTVTIGNATGATSVTYNGTLALGRTTRLEAGNASGSATFNGLISGAGGIVKRGSGTVNLTNAANSFVGDVTLEGGTLSASSLSALGAGTTAFSIQGATLSIAGGGATSRGLLLVSPSNESATVNISSGTLTSTGAIQGGSSGSTFTKSGAGTFIHTGSGTWSGNTVIGGGTFLVTGAGTISETGAVTVSGATLTINTSGQVRATSVSADTSGAVNLQAGTLRTNGMSFTTGGTFNWTGGTLTPRNVGQAGLSEGSTDRNTPGSSLSAERAREGTILDITGGGLATVSGSVLDLDSTFKSGTMRYNQVTITGTLDLSASDDTLRFGFNPYFFRPNNFGSDAAGTLILIDAGPGGFNGGVFNTFTGVGSDQIGFTAAPGSGSVVGVLGVSTLNPLTDIPVNSYYLEYETDTGNVLFHYRLSASVPEPASAGLLVAGSLLLRVIGRRRR